MLIERSEREYFPSLSVSERPARTGPDSRHFQFTFTTLTSSVAMSFTRAFSPTLREIRILFSQTGDASQGVRYARHDNISRSTFSDHCPQAIRPVDLPYDETAQPRPPHTHTGSSRNASTRFCSVRSVVHIVLPRACSDKVAERGVERNVTLDGLTSKDVATKISELLK